MYIDNEVGVLKTAGLFGPPGIESYLAQHYSPEVSLFYSEFDIFRAQSEWVGLARKFEELGVKVQDIKKRYAQGQDNSEISAEELVKRLQEKVPSADTGIIEGLLQYDTTRYGEEKAVALNEALSLNPDIPMGNIFFSRDQMNVAYGTAIVSQMKYPIRRPEVRVVTRAVQLFNLGEYLYVPQGTIEGGDTMIINGNLYIGTGSRTSQEAVEYVRGHMRTQGKKTYAVHIPPTGTFNGDQDIMHLDTFFMPVSYDTAIACTEVTDRCYVTNGVANGQVSFNEHIEGLGYGILPIPANEQKRFAANVVVVRPGEIITAEVGNEETVEMLRKNNISVHTVPLETLTNAWGATHCMVLQTEKYSSVRF